MDVVTLQGTAMPCSMRQWPCLGLQPESTHQVKSQLLTGCQRCKGMQLSLVARQQADPARGVIVTYPARPATGRDPAALTVAPCLLQSLAQQVAGLQARPAGSADAGRVRELQLERQLAEERVAELEAQLGLREREGSEAGADNPQVGLRAAHDAGRHDCWATGWAA